MRPRNRVRCSIPLVAVILLWSGAGSAQAPQQRSQLPPLPVTRLDERAVTADLDAPHAVYLALAQPVSIKDALVLLVRGTAFSVVADENVTGNFAGELKDLTMRQALEAILFPGGLDYTVDGNVIRVHPRRPAMRLFDVSYLNIHREWQRGIRSTSMPGEPGAADATSAVNGSFFDELERGVEALLSSDGRAHLDRQSGIVQVTDLQERLDRVAAYLESVHVRALRQVRLEARVMEVTLNDPAAHGVDWTRVSEKSGQPWASPRGASSGVRVPDFTAVLSALADQGSVRMLATPHVLAMNNEPALMRVGTQDVVFATGARPAPMMQGLTMTITPQITADGVVQLSVSPTYTEKTRESKSRQGDRVPVVSIAEADTLVRMRDGEAVLLSGLLQERTRVRQGTGFAGFFGATSRTVVKSELVILLKATVVAPGPRVVTEAR